MTTRMTDTSGPFVLYESTSEIALGPTFRDRDDGYRFLAWCQERYGDPSRLDRMDLLRYWDAWLLEEDER